MTRAEEKAKKAKKYGTIVRSLLTAVEQARDLGNNILADSLNEQLAYAYQQYQLNQPA